MVPPVQPRGSIMQRFLVGVFFIIFASFASAAQPITADGWFHVGASGLTAVEYEQERAIRYYFTDEVSRCMPSSSSGFVVGIYDNGTGELRYPEYGQAPMHEIPKEWITFVLYGEEAAQTSGLSGPFTGVGNRVYVPAVQMSPRWFCAAIVYALAEMKHRAADQDEPTEPSQLAAAVLAGHTAARRLMTEQYLDAVTRVANETNPAFQFETSEEVRAIMHLCPPALSEMEEEVRYRQIYADITILRIERIHKRDAAAVRTAFVDTYNPK
jgi:hypothetical protein